MLGGTLVYAQPPAELFPEEANIAPPGPYGHSAIVVNLDGEGIARGRKFILVKLPGAGIVRFTQTDYEYRGNGNALWLGNSPDHTDSSAIFTLHEGKLVARIGLEGDLYLIKPGPGSLHTAVLLDEESFPECDINSQEETSVPASTHQAGSSGEESQYLIDLLSVYTPGARDKAGGVSEVEAMIQAAVDNANTAFIESNVNAQYRLVHVQQVSYTTGGSTSDDLSWVADDPEVAALRDQYGADMVSVISDTPNSCGTARVQRNPGPDFADSAFQATDIDCAVGNLTFAHEHGHNLGMEHNPENSSVGDNPANASYEFSFAHYVDGSYRTVMSYSAQCNDGCTRVMRHSNPDVLYNGVATGIGGARDNAQTADLTAPITANFRSTVADPASSANVRITQSGDDIEENTVSGEVYPDSSDLEFGLDSYVGAEQLLGLRFLNVGIPAGAAVTEAYLEFTVDEVGSDTTTAQIRILATDDVDPFTLVNGELSSRATSGAISWSIPPWTTVGETDHTPDLSSLVQSVVDRGGWAQGNSVGFVISASGGRIAEAWDGEPASAPLLHVTWDAGGEPPAPPANVAPEASFSTIVNDLTVSFTDSSTDGNNNIAQWYWDFGDGNQSSDQHPTHSYVAGDDYTVSLQVTDSGDLADSFTRVVTVAAPEPVPPAVPSNLSKQVEQTGKGKRKELTAVNLTWQHSSGDATHFVLERCLESITGKGKNRQTVCDYETYIEEIPGEARSVEVDVAEDFRYQLKAVNPAGESGWSNSVKI
jgi:PKD repeat protein